MKRHISNFAIILFLFVLVLTGCKGLNSVDDQTAETLSSASVYYISENGSELVAENVKISDTSRKGQVKYLIEQLISPPNSKKSPICDGTKLNSVAIKDEIAVVDFSKEFSNSDDLKQTLAPVAVAKTLCSLDFISGVKILVEGQEALGTDGKPLGIIKESDLVLNNSKTTSAPKTTVVLYFSDENSEYLVAERRNVEISGNDTVEKVIVNELLKGPTEGGHLKTIPQEAKILSIETKDNVCFVNFSKEFAEKASGGTTGEMLTVYSVVNSLTELVTVDMVQFLVEGEKREEFIHMAFNEPIARNEFIIK